MVISVLQPLDVVRSSRHRLGLPGEPASVDEAFLSAIVRHTAGQQCPCSRASLRTAISACLTALVEPDLDAELVENAIEACIVSGDLLELQDVTAADETALPTWLYAAPPAFTVRPGGTVFLIGIARDMDLFLPQSLGARVAFDGSCRTLVPQPGEDLAAELSELGLHEVSQEAWLRSPRQQTAASLLADMLTRLSTTPTCGVIDGLQILDPDRPARFYKGRWVSPAAQTGHFIARRPQEYGFPIWGLAALEQGRATKFLDFPLASSRWRGCDAAWHLQMAIDKARGHPQIFRRSASRDLDRFDFFSPLPLWAQRRFMLLGRAIEPERALFSFLIPSREADAEETYLIERLYLRAKPASTGD